MKRTVLIALISVGTLAVFGATAFGQYRPPPDPREESAEEDSFKRSIALNRFRKGSPQWNTQELVAAGLTALHEEHLEILRELKSLKEEVNQLKEKK